MKIGLKKGFTLIELLIVIAIIGILAVALLPTILGAPAKGRDAARKGHLSALLSGIETYNLDKGSYPTSTNGCLVASEMKAYVQGGVLPVDPSKATGSPLFASSTEGCTTAGGYGYVKILSGETNKNYLISAFMEIPADANAKEGYGTACTTLGSVCAANGAPTVCAPLTQTTSSPEHCIFMIIK